MLLVIDVGNTNTAIGLYNSKNLVHDWRLATDRYRTADEWGQLLRSLLHLDNIDLKDIDDIVIACVVPPLESTLERACQRYFHKAPLFISFKSKMNVEIDYINPAEIGADRLVNAVAAIERHGYPSIIIDFGTATTFDVVDADKKYVGGVICPGIGISSNALYEKAAKLPRIDLKKPDKVIGSNTVESMQSGLYYGYLEQIKGIIDRIIQETRQNYKIITTGGLSRIFEEGLGGGVIRDQTLTLEGLRILYQLNKK